jgi:hypothetical protein
VLKVVTLLSTLRDPTQLRQRQCATRQQHPFFVVLFDITQSMQKECKKYAKYIQKVSKMYENIMQKHCNNYAKSIQKIMQKGYSHALHTHIYMDYARHGEIQGCSLALGTQILIAHQKQGIDRTKKVTLAAKKSTARD